MSLELRVDGYPAQLGGPSLDLWRYLCGGRNVSVS